MTPLALWTGRLPGLGRLPRLWTLWGTGGVVLLATAGAFGLLGPMGLWLGPLGSLVAGATVWRHRWPRDAPMGLHPHEAPQGADERTVVVEFRHERALLGWDVGILWFERGGVGFVGRTVSFVLPRAMMGPTPDGPFFESVLRAPRFKAKVFETTLIIVPIAYESNAQLTLARIDALPHEITSETILPPSSLHPDLLARGLTVRRRLPALYALLTSVAVIPNTASVFDRGFLTFRLVGLAFAPAFFLLFIAIGGFLPRAIRDRLPKEPRRRRGSTWF